MRLRFASIAIVLLFATSLPAFAQWGWGRPATPRAGACFYQDPNFSGNYFCLKVGERWPAVPAGFNDRITSIRVFGRARLRVFNASDFGGVSLFLDHDVNDLRRIPVNNDRDKNWNDRISSLAVFQDRDEWENHRPDAAPPARMRDDDDDDRRHDRSSWHSGDRDSACGARRGDGAHWCDNFQSVHEARPIRESGRRPCEFNRNWGVEGGRLWVSDGCSAVFEYR
jgi:hypothetical protein